jgi:DnaK suppressor protein
MGLMERAAERLAAERRRALERLAGLTRDYESVVSASRDTNADDEHDPEGATIAFERSQIAALSRHIRGHIEEIDGAFARLETGTAGANGAGMRSATTGSTHGRRRAPASRARGRPGGDEPARHDDRSHGYGRS